MKKTVTKNSISSKTILQKTQGNKAFLDKQKLRSFVSIRLGPAILRESFRLKWSKTRLKSTWKNSLSKGKYTGNIQV